MTSRRCSPTDALEVGVYCALGCGAQCDPANAYDTVLTANVALAVRAGDFGRAFRFLNAAVDGYHPGVIYMRLQSHTWPAAFLTDPRWQEYLKQVGLDDIWRDELCLRAQRLEPYTGIDVACAPG